MIIGASLIATQGQAVLQEENRFKHLLCLGASGTGKTSAFLHLINDSKDHANIILDPSGGLAPKSASLFPEERLVYVNKDNPISLNPLSRNLPKSVLANELSEMINSAVRAINPDQVAITVKMARILRNAIEVIDEKDLSIDFVSEFLDHKEVRKRYFQTRTKPLYWKEYDKDDYQHQQLRMSGERISDRFSLLCDDEALSRFLFGKNELDIESIARDKKAVVIDCSGMDDEVTAFVGNLVTHQIKSYYIHQAKANSPPLFFYIDEWHWFITEFFDRILVEARKYNISFNMSGHALTQVDRKLVSVALSAFTKIIFQCDYNDTERIFKNLGLKPEYIHELGKFEAIVGIGTKYHHVLMDDPLELEEYTPPEPEPEPTFLRPGYICAKI